MGYYIRILGTRDPDIHLDELLAELHSNNLTAQFALGKGEIPGKWANIQISNDKGEAIVQIEKNPVLDGELGQEELEEFKEEVQEYKPVSAAIWLNNYFDQIKVIYAFQLLDAAFQDNNYDIINAVRTKIWNKVGGILQADNEGFSNEDGYHILWQFSENVTGEWSCAILNALGNWETFVTDLGDKTQRKEFQDGNVPKKAKRI